MNLDDQVRLLMQGTEYGDETLRSSMEAELRSRLEESIRTGRPLRVYCGFDPTHADLHLGHTIPMYKLRQFQNLGHDVTFLIGSFTALVGDPSDKNKARPILTQDQVAENARTYREQAFRVLDSQKTTVRSNGEWLAELSLLDLIRLGQNFTIQQFLARENFDRRLSSGEPIYLHETFYALMQGYDATALRADVQVGGTDQLFNIIVAGRKLQEALGQRPLVGIICGILPGTDGVQRMSKSTGNVIPINTTAEDMFGKVMSIPDAAMGTYFRLVSRRTPDEISMLEDQLKRGEVHPRDAKATLALDVVSTFYGRDAAVAAQEAFVRIFQLKKAPEDLPEYSLRAGQSVLDVILGSGLAPSRSQAQRLLEQGGIRLDGQVLERGDIPFPRAGILQAGKRHFVRIKQDKGS